MTDAEAQAAIEACEKASISPWSVIGPQDDTIVTAGEGPSYCVLQSDLLTNANAAFIVLARTALSQALADRAELLALVRAYFDCSKSAHNRNWNPPGGWDEKAEELLQRMS